MSKLLKRVEQDAKLLGLEIEIIHTPDGTHTAVMASSFVGCTPAQIAKSILFRRGAADSDDLVMFITSGAYRVDMDRAASLLGQPLFKADADVIRRVTGFAIGGVAPIGSLMPITHYFDRNLLGHDRIFAAAGTPQHLFEIVPQALLAATNATLADFTLPLE